MITTYARESEIFITGQAGGHDIKKPGRKLYSHCRRETRSRQDGRDKLDDRFARLVGGFHAVRFDQFVA
jgi:hypothetical protein